MPRRSTEQYPTKIYYECDICGARSRTEIGVIAAWYAAIDAGFYQDSGGVWCIVHRTDLTGNERAFQLRILKQGLPYGYIE